MTFIDTYRASVHQAIDAIDSERVSQAIDWFRDARDAGHHIFVCGNGGSVSTASRLNQLNANQLRQNAYCEPV